MIITDKEWIIDFLSGNHCDYKGRLYEDILYCSDEEMERCHDQVQWIFPLHESSNFASTYPIVNQEIIEDCLVNPNIIENISMAIKRMSDFYGFDPTDREKQKKWCKNNDHNLLRITRIIRSARLFKLDKEAEDFFVKACDASKSFNIENKTISYWEKARYEGIYSPLK